MLSKLRIIRPFVIRSGDAGCAGRLSKPMRNAALGICVALACSNSLAGSRTNALAERVWLKDVGPHHEYEVWRIDAPVVTDPNPRWYSDIRFTRGDRVRVAAGGCVQTGGLGRRTWKRYVDSTGKDSDRIYHGRINIPGATDGLIRVGATLNKDLEVVLPPHYDGAPMVLELAYEDGDRPSHYADNGYWGTVRSTQDQCQGDGPAWLEVSIFHAPMMPPPDARYVDVNSPCSLRPMDLWWTKQDVNGLPLNPVWVAQLDCRPGHANPPPVLDDAAHVPDASALCGFHNEGDNFKVNNPPCVSWHPDVDETHAPLSFICHRDHPAGTVHGHINWGAATYTGSLYFTDFQKVPFLDGDYDLEFVPNEPRYAGLTSGNFDPTISSRKGLVLEAKGKETFDLLTKDSWFGKLTKTVHDDAPLIGLPWKDYRAHFPHVASVIPDAGLPAIAIGLFGIDHQHRTHTELHPLWGLAVQIASSPGEEDWAIFARNWGNEGECSQDQHFLNVSRLKFLIPNRNGLSLLEKSFKQTSTGTLTIEPVEDGILVTLPLDLPGRNSKTYIYGQIRLGR